MVTMIADKQGNSQEIILYEVATPAVDIAGDGMKISFELARHPAKIVMDRGAPLPTIPITLYNLCL